ncbi:hypothetical protein WMY93_021960 [Mugilogobius chulae]|uniref:Uncharacterized protein n=1 Tax=Mugilogobius chulae TaxID=88201 RepID=A0AAW0NFA7_9GOBI
MDKLAYTRVVQKGRRIRASAAVTSYMDENIVKLNTTNKQKLDLGRDVPLPDPRASHFTPTDPAPAAPRTPAAFPCFMSNISGALRSTTEAVRGKTFLRSE